MILETQSPLPAEEEGPRGKGRFGFVRPDKAHLAHSANALRRVAEHFNSKANGNAIKRIRLGHVENNGMLAILLYGFPVLDFDSNGTLLDVMRSDIEIKYALVANLPIRLQVQTTIAFLADFVARQEYFADRTTPKAFPELADIDRKIADIDRLSQEEVIDDLRLGWEAAANRILLRAQAIGMRLQLTYEGALLPRREDLVARLPIVKAAYNTIDAARQAIDRTVAIIGRSEPLLRKSKGPEAIRAFVQEATITSSLRRYLSHLLRDSLVCGNGYLVLRRAEPFSLYCIDPAHGVVLDNRQYAIDEAGGTNSIGDPVVHFCGLSQIGSKYGMSVLEPIIPLMAMRDATRSSKQEADQILRTSAPTDDQRRELEQQLALNRRIESQVTARIAKLLPVPLSELSDPDVPLYFAGHDRY